MRCAAKYSLHRLLRPTLKQHVSGPCFVILTIFSYLNFYRKCETFLRTSLYLENIRKIWSTLTLITYVIHRKTDIMFFIKNSFNFETIFQTHNFVQQEGIWNQEKSKKKLGEITRMSHLEKMIKITLYEFRTYAFIVLKLKTYV